MRVDVCLAAGLLAVGLLSGCQTFPPGAERGPDGTIAYQVQVEASEPGVRIEANHQPVGTAPCAIKIFGDLDGTFHDFGSYYYIVQAIPAPGATNQFVQTAVFRTGRWFTPEDHIPNRINFDMHQMPPPPPPGPMYPPPAYYYGPPPGYFYYGPSVYIGPRYYYGPHVYWHRHY